jgi:hypothetical protein
VELAKFEDWDPAGRAFDAVVAGQTWHRIDPVAGAAKAASVLRPEGRLSVIWNAGAPPPELARAFAAVHQAVAPDSLTARRGFRSTADAYAPLCARAAQGMESVGAFDQPVQSVIAWTREYTRDEWLDQLPTSGDASQYSAIQLAPALAGVGQAIDASEVGSRFATRRSQWPRPAWHPAVRRIIGGGPQESVTLTDAGPLIAIIEADEPDHASCLEALNHLTIPLMTTWPAFTEATTCWLGPGASEPSELSGRW